MVMLKQFIHILFCCVRCPPSSLWTRLFWVLNTVGNIWDYVNVTKDDFFF